MACSQPDLASTPPRRLPLRGGLLSLLASAFRVRDGLAKEDVVGMAKATAKRVLEDDPQVAPEKRAALVRALVAAIFTPVFLAARGLSAEEATVHNGLVAAALEDVLDRWDEQVRAIDHGVEVEGPIVSFYFLATGFETDVIVRCAAYLALYQRLHPVLAALPSWLAQPGLKGAYQDLVGRTRGGPPSLERLRKDTHLDKKTLKALRNGSSDLPQGETIARVAEAFAHYGVTGRDGVPATAAEIELELRAACAAARVRERIVADPDLQAELDLPLVQLQRLRSELRRYGREELAAIVVKGMRWPRAEEIQRILRAQAMQDMIGIAAQMRGQAQRLERMVHERPVEALREMAAQMASTAPDAGVIAALDRRGGPKLVRFIARFHERAARLADVLALAPDERAALEAPAERRGEDDFDMEEIGAEGLVLQAMVPWETRTDAEREALLREAVARCPSSTYVRLHLVDFLSARGKEAEALSHLYAARGEHPEDPEIREQIASLLLPSEPEEALAELETAHRLGAPTTLSLALQGEALRLLGRIEEAEEALRRALELHGRNTFALHCLALCRRAAGDERGARRLDKEVERYRSPG